MKIIKPKKCRICGNEYFPRSMSQKACSPICALTVVARDKQKKEARERKLGLEKIKSRFDYLKEAQAEFNRYIRVRDEHLPCISCGRMHQGQWHAGHYLSTGAKPELRFDEFNVHRQCQPCNTHLHGNLIMYRVELIKRIGQAEVDRLEGPCEPKKYSIDDLKQIKAFYRQKTKDLIKDRINHG